MKKIAIRLLITLLITTCLSTAFAEWNINYPANIKRQIESKIGTTWKYKLQKDVELTAKTFEGKANNYEMRIKLDEKMPYTLKTIAFVEVKGRLGSQYEFVPIYTTHNYRGGNYAYVTLNVPKIKKMIGKGSGTLHIIGYNRNLIRIDGYLKK